MAKRKADSARGAPTRVGPVRSATVAPPAPVRVGRGRGGGGRRVRWLRVALPLAAVGLVAALFLTSERRGGFESFPIVAGAQLAAGIEVKNPRYNGATADGSPFSLRAAVARPDGPDPKEITLEDVSGRFGMADARTMEARADEGVYDREENAVRLEGDVTVTSDDGYRIRSASARVDLEAMEIVTTDRVEADGPVGELSAGSMRARQADGGVVLFENGVRMTIRRLVESKATGE